MVKIAYPHSSHYLSRSEELPDRVDLVYSSSMQQSTSTPAILLMVGGRPVSPKMSEFSAPLEGPNNLDRRIVNQ